MANYSKWEEYLKTQHDSFEIEFKEIEKIIGKLPLSAYEYKEWWSNHPSHPNLKTSNKLLLKRPTMSQNMKLQTLILRNFWTK